MFFEKALIFIRTVFQGLEFKDFLDILLTSFLIYSLFWFLRKTKSTRVILFVIFVFLIYISSYWFNFSLTHNILQGFVGAFLIIFIVIFQEEIKRIFYFVGGSRKKVEYKNFPLNDLVDVVFKMAKEKIGAIIVIPGKETLIPHISGGIKADAKFSKEIVFSIFDPSSPGHDGALILDDFIIKYFGVYLPISKEDGKLKDYGTRHRAGLGIAEKTDAISIIVSEEKGSVSVARGKNIFVVKNKEQLVKFIGDFLKVISESDSGLKLREKFLKFLKGNLQILLGSVFLSLFIWIITVYPNLGITQKSFIVPIEFINVKSGFIVENIKPDQFVVTFSGRSQDFKILNPSSLKISLDLAKKTEIGKYKITITKENLKYPSNLILVDINPENVQFQISLIKESF